MNGSLIFAYFEGVVQHRLYFKDGLLFRWNYTNSQGEVSCTAVAAYWEKAAKTEGSDLYDKAVEALTA
jgi:hypothetical protein